LGVGGRKRKRKRKKKARGEHQRIYIRRSLWTKECGPFDKLRD
jgi:hypothetical protein